MLPLGLRLYEFRHGRGGGGAIPAWPERAAGRHVWLAARDGAAAASLRLLGAELKARRLADHILLTAPDPAACPPGACIPQGPDARGVAEAFAAHWQPQLGILAGGPLRPVTLDVMRRRGIPLCLVADEVPAPPDAWRWPGLVQGALAAFERILVTDAELERAYIRAGVDPARLEICGPLQQPSFHLPATEAERAAIARMLGTRPVWLAMAVPGAEDDIVARAHLEALRVAHRLLLILVPDRQDRGADLAGVLAERYGLSVALRSRDEEPVDDVQVLVCDTEGEDGLWYRLAARSYMGGSLTGPGPMRHPFEAAAQGSALVLGPVQGSHAPGIARLQAARGVRMLASAAALGPVIGDLLAADKAADLARAAWAVATEGAETTDRLCAFAARVLAGDRQASV